ncbi:WD-repeat-containing protein [Rhodotorula toruloides ATCC 204091]|uniref:BY PROTMAP: gi/342320177/gb/EGU12119.1/ WD-repeat-containing protein [Rhodotorula glutinis ATCC 204091] n=1 Tax=Rhodotorula toruloides TaxID=5286 RepID=A0A0K3CR65_RHOTO|nr:WD-repeat-containing protein [Rhodotorula toruloides ATCC 204091]
MGGSPTRDVKGKGRARDDDDDADEDDLYAENGGDEQDASNGAGEGDEADEDEEEEDDDGSKIEKQRAVRAEYRKLQSTTDDLRGDLQNASVDALADKVLSANVLFKRVDRPSEAILDSHVLIATSEAGALKARQLKIDADAFDTDEFIPRLVKFMGGQANARDARRKRTRGKRAAESDEDELDDDEVEFDRPMKWIKVGRVLAAQSRRPAPLDFMYGPLAIEVKEKKARTQRAKNQIDEAEKMRPEELQADDVAKNENETGKVTAKIAKRLQEVAGDRGIPFLEFIINPHSFAQSVENAFFFSFLVREQKAAIEVDEDESSPTYGDTIAFIVDPETAASTAAQGAKKVQIVLELTQDVWKEAIEAYEIEEPVIPHREAFVAPTATGKKPPTILDYHSDCPTFALSVSPLSNSSPSSLRLAVGSYNETRTSAQPSSSSSSNGAAGGAGLSNNFTVASLDPAYLDLEDASDSDSETAYRSRTTRQRVSGGSAFRAVARAPLLYPPSSVQFAPAKLSSSLGGSGGGVGAGGEQREVLATTSECLRLWDLVTEQEDGAAGRSARGYVGGGAVPTRNRLVSRATLQNSKVEFSAPLTSFSWSMLQPIHIVTSSIDTTCTVWDISTGVPVTQLIAHDREVYDVEWSPQSPEIFASVGADGSVRMFDLRSLEHSTILYEAAPAISSSSSKHNGGSSSTSPPSTTATPPPLLRLAFSPTSPTYLAVIHAESNDVQILDTRSPGQPAFEVKGHKAPVNGLAWGGATMMGGAGETSGPGWLTTVSDDATLLLWDLSTSQPHAEQPSRSAPQQPKRVSTPSLAYTAPSEINAVAWGGGGEWVTIGCGRVVRSVRC